MAVRDRNMLVWQRYVIASSICSVLLLAALFYFWRQSNDNARLLEAKNKELVTAGENFQATKEKLDRVMSMIGVGQWTQSDIERMKAKFAKDPEMEPIETQFARIETLFPANTPLSEINLMRLPQLLLDTIRIRNEEMAKARAATNQLQVQMTKEIEDHRRAREAAELAQQKSEKDLADARVDHKKQLETVNREKAANLAQFDKFKSDFDSRFNELANTNRELVAQKDLLNETIARQLERIQQFDTPDYAAAQGRISQVGSGGTEAWINLGTAHGLRRGVQFSILDSSEVQIANAVPKAKMIIQDVSETGARGEIYFGDDANSRNRYYKNVVKEGDLIYSPVWRPGRKVSFALVGKMDINGDLIDDFEQVKQLIEAAGGVIDAELSSKGTEKGKITPQTTYLVLGSDVTSSAENPNELDKSVEYSKFLSKVSQSGVITKISVDKLLGFLKVDESSRIIPMGNRSQGTDFKIRNQVTPPASSGRVSEIFDRYKPKP